MMIEKDKKFISTWSNKMAQGALDYYVKITLLTCLISAGVVLFYTWNSIPEDKHLESIIPLSALTFGLGIPLGLVLSWLSWTKSNNRYKFLTTNNNLDLTNNNIKQQWRGYERVWDIAISNIAVIYFVLFYVSTFLFDSGNPSLLKYSVVGVILSYFAAQMSYAIYRYKIDNLGNTKRFPAVFKYLFSITIVLTILSWLMLIFVEY